jgi:hypothetical protein
MANSRPDLQFEAVETAPVPFALSWLRFKLFAPANCKVHYADIWKTSLADYAWVYCFLSPQPMPEIFAKVRREMKPGSRLVSNSFDIPGAEASRALEVNDGRKSRLLIWDID